MNWFSSASFILIAFCFFLGCTQQNPHQELTTADLQKDDSGTWTMIQLEAKVKMLEQKLEEHEEFVKKSKEVLASHRSKIIEQENLLKVMTHPRYQPKNSNTGEVKKTSH